MPSVPPTAETTYRRVKANELCEGMSIWNQGCVEAVETRRGPIGFHAGRSIRFNRVDVTFDDGRTLAYDEREIVLLDA